jgi:hypothetical protein
LVGNIGHVAAVAYHPQVLTDEYIDLPTGHWPQLTKPVQLGQAILAAVDRPPDEECERRPACSLRTSQAVRVMPDPPQRARPCFRMSTDFAMRRCRVSSVLAPST